MTTRVKHNNCCRYTQQPKPQRNRAAAGGWDDQRWFFFDCYCFCSRDYRGRIMRLCINFNARLIMRYCCNTYIVIYNISYYIYMGDYKGLATRRQTIYTLQFCIILYDKFYRMGAEYII